MNPQQTPLEESHRTLAGRLWPLLLADCSLLPITKIVAVDCVGRQAYCRACGDGPIEVRVDFWADHDDRSHRSASLESRYDSTSLCGRCYQGMLEDLEPADDPTLGIKLGGLLVKLAKRSLMTCTAEYLMDICPCNVVPGLCDNCRRVEPYVHPCTKVIADFAATVQSCKWRYYCIECLLAHIGRFKAAIWAQEVARLAAIAAWVRLVGTAIGLPADVIGVIWLALYRSVDPEEVIMNCPEITGDDAESDGKMADD